MAEITGPQKRKDTYYALCSAAHALNRRYHRYIDESIISDKATKLTDQILSAAVTPVVDADFFAMFDTLKVLQENNKDALVVENIESGYKIQTPIEDDLSNPKIGLKDVRIKNSSLEYSDYNPRTRYAGFEKLAFENVSFTGMFSKSMPAGTVTDLTIERCSLGKVPTYDPTGPRYMTMCSNALDIASKNPIKHMFLNEMSLMTGEPDKEPAPADWSKLPVTLEYLSLEKTDIMNANFDGLMEALPNLKNLKVLDLASCGLTDEHGQKLKKALQSSQATIINLTGNHFSEPVKNELEAIKDKNVSASWEYTRTDKERTLRDIANERPIAAYLKGMGSKKDILESDLLAAALKGQAFRDVLDAVKNCGEKMVPADYDKKIDSQQTLLGALIETKQLSDVFEPKYWDNPKEMQAVWDKVPEKDRAQLGGKDGKVAFMKRKNQVMANTVKSVLSQRTKRMR